MVNPFLAFKKGKRTSETYSPEVPANISSTAMLVLGALHPEIQSTRFPISCEALQWGLGGAVGPLARGGANVWGILQRMLSIGWSVLVIRAIGSQRSRSTRIGLPEKGSQKRRS